MSVLLDGPFCFALAVRQRPRSSLKSHRLLNLTGSLALFSCMECDHNEMGGAEMSLRSKLAVLGLTATLARSEAHTSELKSLMRTSYAVVCLTKKSNTLNQIL